MSVFPFGQDHDPEQRTYKCLGCKQEFDGWREYEQHRRRMDHADKGEAVR